MGRRRAVAPGPNNWLHNCGGPDTTTLTGCTFAEDYASMIEVVKGQAGASGVQIHVAIPPPLHAQYSIGANQTVINSVYPKLVPLIAKANKITAPVIDIYSGMGGTTTWQKDFPKSCTLDSAKTYTPCECGALPSPLRFFSLGCWGERVDV
jgi:hypothetical protein